MAPIQQTVPLVRPIPLIQEREALARFTILNSDPALALAFYQFSCILRALLLHSFPISACSEQPVSLFLWVCRRASESDDWKRRLDISNSFMT